MGINKVMFKKKEKMQEEINTGLLEGGIQQIMRASNKLVPLPDFAEEISAASQ